MSNKEIKATITADNKQFKRGIDDSKKQVNKFDGAINSLKNKLGMLAGAAAIGAVIKGLVSMAIETGKVADRLLDLEQITGASTDKLQEWEHVARVAGVNSEFYANAVQGLTMRLARGAEISAAMQSGIDRLNISMTDASGNMRNGAEITEEAIEKLAALDSVTERNIVGAQLFTGAWKDLAPVLALGADGIEAAKNEARDLGLVMGKDSLEAANAFRVEVETLNAQWDRMKMGIGLKVIPALSSLITYMGTLKSSFQGFLEVAGITAPKIEFDIRQVEESAKYTVDSIIEKFKEGGEKSAEELINEYQRVIDQESNKIRMPEPKRGAFPVGKDGASMFAMAVAEAQRYNAVMDDIIKYSGFHIEQLQQKQISEESVTGELTEQEKIITGISRLEKELAEERKAFNSASMDDERQRHLIVMTNLEIEIEKLKEMAAIRAGQAEADARGMGGLSGMDIGRTGNAAMFDDGHQSFLKAMGEQKIAMRSVQEEADKTSENYSNLAQSMTGAAMAVGIAMGQMASDSGKSTSEIIQQMLRQVTASLMQSMMVSLPFPANLIAATGAGAIAGGLFAFADGGIVSGPTMGLVGEYPGARSNPEVIAPLDRLQGMLSGGAMGGKVEFVIKGNTLYGLLAQENNKRRQTT